MEEINNLKETVKDLEESVQDAYESETARKKQLEEQRAIVESVFTQILSENVETNDVSSLVKKSVKRLKTCDDSSYSQVTSEGDAKTASIDNIESLEPNLKKKKIEDEVIDDIEV